MSTFQRWLRFNLVGVFGMAVQLTALAGLNRVLRGHYLWATGVALEVTLLHNFLWHERLTWRDRSGGQRLQRLVRFHLSNGAVSLVGNLVLMRLLVQGGRMPVMPANVIAIIACSIANFSLSHKWAFAVSPRSCQLCQAVNE